MRRLMVNLSVSIELDGPVDFKNVTHAVEQRLASGEFSVAECICGAIDEDTGQIAPITRWPEE